MKEHPYDRAIAGPPIGRWSTQLGSADCLMKDRLVLRADGTGSLDEHSVIRGPAHCELLWRWSRPGRNRAVLFGRLHRRGARCESRHISAQRRAVRAVASPVP